MHERGKDMADVGKAGEQPGTDIAATSQYPRGNRHVRSKRSSFKENGVLTDRKSKRNIKSSLEEPNHTRLF